jgi:hypothetical protein
VFLENVFDLGSDGRATPMDGHIDLAVHADEVQVRIDRGPQLRAGRQHRVGLRQLSEAERICPNGLYVELALAAKVVIEKPLRDVRHLGDLVYRHILVGTRGEHLRTQLEELAATFIGLQADAASADHDISQALTSLPTQELVGQIPGPLKIRPRRWR